MSLFPETIARDLARKKVEMALLVLFDFTSRPLRLWRGNGVLRTNDGERWQGLGALGAVTGIEQAVNGTAPEMEFTLSATNAEVLLLARNEFDAEVKGRLVYVLIQFFGVDDPADPDNQRPLDNPYPIACARVLTPDFGYDQKGEYIVKLKAESLFSLRSRPRFAMYTDADQQQRFVGDEGFAFVGTLINKVVTWPDY